MDPEVRVQKIEFTNTGLNVRIDPKRLPAGTFQFLQNVMSEQEGSLTTRRGRKRIGNADPLGGGGTGPPHSYAKFIVATGESAGTPSTNYRYIGHDGHIYRTQDFSSYLDVGSSGQHTGAQPVCVPPTVLQYSPLWSAATYNAGTSGRPMEFFATQNFMLKEDSANITTSPGNLNRWGILPAWGVPTAQSLLITAATNASPIQITTNLAHNQITGDEVDIRGAIGNTAANGQWFITKVDAFNFTLNGSTGNGTYTANTAYLSNDQGLFPNGAAPGSPGASVAYTYVYTYANSKTGWEGNPTQIMLANSAVTNGVPAASYNNYISISNIYMTDDPQVDLIYLYRQGGTFADGLYRRIQVFGNIPAAARVAGIPQLTTQGNGNPLPYNDVCPDDSIKFNPVFLNRFADPPVPSTAKTSLVSQLFGTSATTYGPGWTTVTTTPGTNFFANGAIYGATLGSVVHFEGGEDAVVAYITFTNQGVMYLQQKYAGGTQIECDTICGQPCTLVTQAFDAMFVAGDPANPQVLYKSSTGFPEAFPVADENSDVQQINIGNPGNPIINITEFRGNILCMCQQSLFEVSVFNGIMLAPNETPARRGLMAKDAWCEVDNEIWYLGYDGIWSWDGSNSIKRSEAVDQIFHSMTVASGTAAQLNPIDYTVNHVQFTKMAYYQRQVFVLYTDVSGGVFELVYDTLSHRWTQMVKDFAGNHPRVIWTEQDTGNFIYIRDGGVTCIDDAENPSSNNTGEEWVSSAANDGTTISATAITGWLDFGDQYTPKIFDEILLDIDPNGPVGGQGVDVTIYADYNLSSGITAYLINSATTGRQWMSLGLNVVNDATAGGLSRYSLQNQVLAFSFLFGAGPQRPTLYGMMIRYRPVGMITGGPVVDWNDLGHPWDKRLNEFTLWFDTLNTARTLILDTINGISGNTVNLDVATYSITNPTTTGPSRGLQTFAIPDGTIAKLVRLRAITTQSGVAAPATAFFRILNQDWQFAKFPADIVNFTEPTEFGYPCEKVARNLILKIDTGNVACTVKLIGDGNTSTPLMTTTVTTTLDDWERIIPVPTNPDKIAKLFKLELTPGTNGKAQLFDWSLDFVREPCFVAAIDTFEVDFNFPGWKYIKMGWFDYASANTLTLTILRDGGSTFYSTTLPAHSAFRDMTNLYFPAISGGQFNKSKKYRFQMTSSTPFKLYSNTRIDWMPWNGDQRSSFQPFRLSPEQQLPVSAG